MKKILFIVFISLMFFFQADAQKGTHSVGIGPSLGIPVSNKNFSYYYKNGIGGSLQANFGLTKLGSVTANVLFVSIGAKNLPITSKNSLTLIKVGYRTNFSDSRFFVSADGGLANYRKGSKYFIVAAAVGYSFKISKGSYIDLFPSYAHILKTPSNSIWLTANILYRLNIKKKNK